MMRRWLCRFFRLGCPSPVRPGLGLAGVVAHPPITPLALDRLKAARAWRVRLTLYTKDPIGFWQQTLGTLRHAGIEPLVVVHDFPTRASVADWMRQAHAACPGVRWQLGNEWGGWPDGGQPDWMPAWAAAMTGDQYAAIVRVVLTACPGIRLVGQGVRQEPDPVAFLRAYRAAGGPTLEAWCGHAYGDAGFVQRTVEAAVRALNGWMPYWLTEFGHNGTDAAQADHWRTVLANAGAWGADRAYGYVLRGDDGYGITTPDGVRPAYAALAARG